MARSTVTTAYLVALVGFVTRLQKHQDKSLAAIPDVPEFRGVDITIESGNKYDKVLRTVSRARPANPEKTRVYEPEVLYFVEKTTGTIYGAKSPLAPNEMRFYGTVFSATKWDWHGDTGVNVLDETVEEVGGYGDVVHYAPRKVAKAASAERFVEELVTA